jgi:type IVB pilus formation R64 PilN family outer membrane protein
MMNRTIIAALITSILAGCTTFATAPIRDAVLTADSAAKNALAEQVSIAKIKSDALIERVDGVWVPLTKVDASHDRSSLLDRMVVVNRSFKSFSNVAEYISSQYGVSVVVAPDVNGVAGSASAQGKSSSPADQKSMERGLISLVFDGTLHDLLDSLAAGQSVSWEVSDTGIRFFKYRTKSFEIAALPGDTNGANTVSSTGSSNSSGSSGAGGGSAVAGSSAQSSGVSYSLSVWKSIESTVATMLSPDVKPAVNPALGSIVVTDTPTVLAEVGRYIDNLNIQLSKQVLINVRILSVQLDSGDQYGINWTTVFSNLGKVGFTMTNANSIVSSSAAVAGVISVPSGAPGALSNWAGSSAMVQALSTQGDVTQLTSASLTTLNNQPAPMLVGNQQSYLASSSTTAGTAGVQPTVTLTPGQLNTGFSLSIVPHILENDKIMLQYGADISSLVSMGSYTSGSSSIQTPNVNTRSFLQRVKVGSGETLVLTGFEQNNMGVTTQGIGSADNVAAGGGISRTKARTVIVVLLQPVLLK